MYQNHFQMMDMRTIHNSSETIPSLYLITDNSQYQDNISFFPNITLFHRRGAKRLLVSKKNVFNILSLISDSISSVFYKCLVKILLEDNYCYVLLSDKMCWELSELLTILLLYYRCYKQIY